MSNIVTIDFHGDPLLDIWRQARLRADGGPARRHRLDIAFEQSDRVGADRLLAECRAVVAGVRV